MAPWIDFEKIKREADFATVLRHYGLEVPEGRTQLKLRCPFHEDGTPSLSVNLAEKVWHCFGCGERGNVLKFVASIEMLRGKRMSVRQAALVVAELCGLSDYETERPVKGRAKRPETTLREGSLLETVQMASAAIPPLPAAPTGSEEPVSRITAVTLGKLRAEIEAELERDEPAAVNPPLSFTLRLDPTHPYLSERGLSPATIEAFGLGYSSRGMMKGRVCVPIHNERGELVAYAGRWAGPDATIPVGEGKWKLPPKFEKSRVLFNLHRVNPCKHIVLVEGFFGLFRIDHAGLPAVALMGSSLSPHQFELLRRSEAKFLTLMLDGDEAGRRGTIEMLPDLARRFSVRWAELPDGAQPDTVDGKTLLRLLGILS